jgi:hypothetical protein
MKRAGSRLELLEEDAVLGDLGERCVDPRSRRRAMPTGQLAPWRGRRMTRTSWQKYLPPNWAPMPISWVSFSALLLELEVAERAPWIVAGRRQPS